MMASGKGITKSFKVKKAFLGVKEDQPQRTELNGDEELDEGDINKEVQEASPDKPLKLMLDMDPDFDSAFAPEE